MEREHLIIIALILVALYMMNSSSSKDLDVLNDTLIKELEIKEIIKHLYFEYKEKSLQIVLTNNTSGSFPDGDTYNQTFQPVFRSGFDHCKFHLLGRYC